MNFDPNPELDADGERCIDTACTVAGWIAFALVVLGCALAVRYCPDIVLPTDLHLPFTN